MIGLYKFKKLKHYSNLRFHLVQLLGKISKLHLNCDRLFLDLKIESSLMDIQGLGSLIDKIAKDKGLSSDILIDELADILLLKYDVTLMDKERKIVEEVRNKLLTRLYNTDGHTVVKSRADEKRYYRLDELEVRYLSNALEELSREGLIEDDTKQTVLTDAGILKYKSFYGEI